MQKLSGLSGYEMLPHEELIQRIRRHKQDKGSSLVILGHHYQRPQITALSDFVGDSYGLSVKASEAPSQAIVFCGVRFMAESAAILARDGQKVYHPDPDAGCPMADMANMEQVRSAWHTLANSFGGSADEILPVTYMNSTADLKAFCGEQSGSVCTSSNAEKVFRWVFERAPRIFFFPDEHLGRNTARKFGIRDEEMALWNPQKPNGGITAEQARSAKVILWAGHCPVHMEFKARDIENVRTQYPGCKVVVHPECDEKTVQAADAHGSTDFIVKYVAGLPTGATVFIGTEINLINRLQQTFPEKRIFKLQRSLCLTMYQISLANLCFTLDHMDELPTVELPPTVIHNARMALNRMLEISAAG